MRMTSGARKGMIEAAKTMRQDRGHDWQKKKGLDNHGNKAAAYTWPPRKDKNEQ